MPVKKETLPNGTVLYTGAGLGITTDALLLAGFCPVKPRWNLCDLGSGSGVLLLSLVDRGLAGAAVGVELDETAASLLQKAIEENGLISRVQAVCADLTEYTYPALFDLVVANPPYFSAGMQAPAPKRAAARHQLYCTVESVCAAAYRLLKDGGRFCLCWPAEDIAALFAALAQHQLTPKRLQLVRRGQNAVARLALVEARRGGGPGLKILPDRLLPPGATVHY